MAHLKKTWSILSERCSKVWYRPPGYSSVEPNNTEPTQKTLSSRTV